MEKIKSEADPNRLVVGTRHRPLQPGRRHQLGRRQIQRLGNAEH